MNFRRQTEHSLKSRRYKVKPRQFSENIRASFLNLSALLILYFTFRTEGLREFIELFSELFTFEKFHNKLMKYLEEILLLN